MEDRSHDKEKEKHTGPSKLERMLSLHSLDGLVYEKRQRKPVVGNFGSSLAPSRVDRPAQVQAKKIAIADKKTQKQKEKVSKAQQPKAHTPARVEARVESKVEAVIQNNQINELKQMKKRGRPRKQIKQEQEQSNAGEVQQPGQDQNIEEKRQNILIQKADGQITEQQIKSKKIKSKQVQKVDEIVEQEFRGKVQGKTPSAFHRHIKQQLKVQNLAPASPARKEDHPIMTAQQPQNQLDSQAGLNQNQQEQEEDQNFGMKRLRVRGKPSYYNQQQDQDSESNQDQKSFHLNRKSRRLRKTKGEALKKFSILKALSDDEQYQNYEGSRKKKNMNDRDYQINRIFRKQAKPNLPSMSLQVDLTAMSFEFLQGKFGHFDLIHCSLPLDMLVKLPRISSLINRGFLFIWVEYGQIQVGYHWLNRLGFDVIDQIMWVKTNEEVTELKLDQEHGEQIFPNCRSTCLVGYKSSSSQKTEYCTKISNNLIFSPARPNPLDKPDEIYEMGDLMMPGAKKLEIGHKEVGGWMTLRHREAGLTRCHDCLGRSRRQLYYDAQGGRVRCQYCILPGDVPDSINNQVKSQEEPRVIQQKSPSIDSKLYKLNIQNRTLDESLPLVCSKCNSRAPQLVQVPQVATPSQQLSQSVNKNNELFCKNCLTVPAQPCTLQVHNVKQVFFPARYIGCSSCPKTKLHRSYFECQTCKNPHIQCNSCFLGSSTQPVAGSHDWKLVVISESPEMRAQCFTCADECSIPYWGCETCQNWYWCGKCEVGTGEGKAHSHYGREHHLHIII